MTREARTDRRMIGSGSWFVLCTAEYTYDAASPP
jgi:hypothetical protein